MATSAQLVHKPLKLLKEKRLFGGAFFMRNHLHVELGAAEQNFGKLRFDSDGESGLLEGNRQERPNANSAPREDKSV